MKYAWIERHQMRWPITLQCEVLNVSTSGYFEHRHRKNSGPQSAADGKRVSDGALLVHIKAVHAGSKYNLPIAPNILDCNFQPVQPNAVWTGDITYIQTDEGWLYLAVVIDLYSRQVVGWSMQPHMQASLVADALRMAWFRRRPEPGLIYHSDRGSQYCSHAFQRILVKYGMQSSMSRKGNCWDNAPTESLWGALKVGRLYGMWFETRQQAMDEVIDWLMFYNHKRLHSTLGYISPMRFEQNWLAAQLKDAA